MARIVTGVDIGSDSVKFVSVREGADAIAVARVVVMPLDELGRLDDGPEKLAAVRARVAKFGRDAGLRLSESVISVSGRTTMLRYIPVPPVPTWRLDAMMKFEATEQATSRTNGEASVAEPVCAYDYRVLDTPDVEGQSTVLLALSQDATVSERVSIAEAAGARDPDVELTGFALYNAYAYGHGSDDDVEKTVLIVDVGASELNIVLSRSGGLYFARHQGGGGRLFTKAIADALGVPWPEAEAYKRDKGRVPLNVSEDGDVLPEGGAEAAPGDDGSGRISLAVEDAAAQEQGQKVAAALAREASNMARAVEATVMYARAQTKLRTIRIDKVLVSGGGAKLSGLAEFLGRRLGAEVAPLDPLRKLGIGGLSQDDLKPLEGTYSACAIAVGLALSRVVPRAARLDLRRDAAKVQRTFRQRDLYLWAAAALVAASITFWIAGALRDRWATDAAKTAAAEISSSDQEARRAFEAARRRHASLRANLDALGERITSGEDLLRVLSQLKKRTPVDIKLVDLSTSRVKPNPDGQVKPEKPDEAGNTFQSKRIVYLRGYATSTQSLPEAYKLVTTYQKSLEESKDLFERVEQLELHKTESDKGHVAEFLIALNIARAQ